MSDLVERLRSHGVIPESLGGEAAAEIERLRGQGGQCLQCEIERLQKQIADLQQFHDWAAPQCKDYVRQKEEIERLRAEIARLAEAGTGYSQQTVDAITTEREELRAERDQLRERAEKAERDATWYRWLRINWDHPKILDAHPFDDFCILPEALDALIDAAMKEQQP